jgi:hypothetical protein
MTVLIPKGLASAVLATLVVGMGLAGGEVVQGTVYSAIFFSIVYCALLIFWIEHGLLDLPLMSQWFGKFSVAPAPTPEPEPTAGGPRRTKPVIELDEILEDLQEPNPIGLEEDEEGK